MEPSRTYPKLSRSPLALVLCQVKFSPIPPHRMVQAFPDIQEALLRSGFPIVTEGELHQFQLNADKPSLQRSTRWDFRTRDERWSLLLGFDSVLVQTTAYDGFVEFAKRAMEAVEMILKVTEHDKYGVLHRVGLRYINAVRPNADETHEQYLKPSFHGAMYAGFCEDSRRIFVQTTGETALEEGLRGTLVARVHQHNRALPPDALMQAPKGLPEPTNDALVTFIDMDHFIQGNYELEPDAVHATLVRLHDHIEEVLFEHIATPHALDAWS